MPYGNTKLMKSQSFIYRIDTKYALSTMNILHSISLLLYQYQLSQMPRKLAVVRVIDTMHNGRTSCQYVNICLRCVHVHIYNLSLNAWKLRGKDVGEGAGTF